MANKLNGVVDGYPVEVELLASGDDCPGGAITLELPQATVWIYFSDGIMVADNGDGPIEVCTIGEPKNG